MDLQLIKEADAALGITNEEDAATALNQQTLTIIRDIPCKEARSILYSTGEFGTLVQLSRQSASDTTPSILISIAINAVDILQNASTIQATDTESWGIVQMMMGSFLQAQIVSQSTHDKLLALRSNVVPRWTTLNAGIIQTARAQP